MRYYAGRAEEEGELKKMIAGYELTENIILTGELPHREVLQIMKRSKVFLHTSRYEGISVVCQEALNAGCQVISFVHLMHYDISNIGMYWKPGIKWSKKREKF